MSERGGGVVHWVPRLILQQPLLQRLAGDSTLSQFARGASTAFIIMVLSRFVSFPVNIGLARALGTEDFGRYVFVANWLGLLVIVGTIGFNVSLLRFIPAFTAEQDWGALRGVLKRATHLVLLLTALIALIVALVSLLAFERMGERMAYTFLAGCLILPLSGLNAIREASLRAVGRIAWSEGLASIATPALHAVAVITVFFVLGQSVSSYTAMALFGFAEIVTLAIATVVLYRALPPELKLAQVVYRTREWVRVSIPLSFVSGMLLLLSSVDVIIVGIMLGPAQAGVYAVAANLSRFALFGLLASNTAAQPMVADLYTRGDRDGLRRLVTALVWSSWGLAVAIGLTLVVLHNPLLRLFGEDFLGGAGVMMILLAGRVINAITGPSGSLLAMTRHHDLNAVILGAAVVFNIPATVVGIMLFGLEGAALATTLSLTLMTAWTWFEVRRRLGINSSVFAGLPFRQ